MSDIKNWENTNLGSIFKNRKENGHIDEELLSVTGSEGVVRRSFLDRRDTSNKDKRKYLLVKKGDVAYNTMRMWQGVSGVSAFRGIVSPAYTVCEPTERINSAFAGYLFKHPLMISLFKKYSQGLVSDTWNLKYEKFAKINCCLPPIQEQEKIAEILSRIDKSIFLFSLKLKKIEMLISAFRSSVEDVPDYKIYSLQEIISEKTIGTTRRGSGPNKNIPLIKMGDIGRGEIKYINNERIEYRTDLDHLILRKGDILFNTRNTPELVGKTAIFSSSGNFTFDNNLMLLRCKEVVNTSFLNQLMNSGSFLQKLFSISSGTTSVAAIYWNDLKKIKLKLPPVKVQEKISANIESLEKMKLKINNKIEILKNLKMSISSDLLNGYKRVVL